MSRMKVIFLLIMIIIGVTGLILSKDDETVNNDEMVQNELETKIVLYFSNLETGELTKEYRYVDMKSIKENLAGTIIDELLKGPTGGELVSSIPSGTRVNSIKENGGKIEIDFSKEYGKGSRRWITKLT